MERQRFGVVITVAKFILENMVEFATEFGALETQCCEQSIKPQTKELLPFVSDTESQRRT